ncbi:hypothetical protein TI39_contig287g00006 [Zymoseptoria brevis]|uniref:Uncharacterized protein n=1 Tax=Zymoseptoria brevis TaxID=1047168 RepID=A0A0F4GZE5_9PEZI|nr:hypothetical protein TI39_contig287g00006 [Zymoseptoria brevis]
MLEGLPRYPTPTPLPALTDDEVEALGRARATYYYPNAYDVAKAGQDDNAAADGDAADETAADLDLDADDASPQLWWLKEWYATVQNRPITLPGWQPPTALPFSVLDVTAAVQVGQAKAKKKIRATKKSKVMTESIDEGAEVPAESLPTVFKRSHSFIHGRLFLSP